MKKRGKAQISMEYMIILGFVTLSFIPLAIIYFSYSNDTKDQIVDSQVNQIGKKIIDSAESVYYLGESSRTTIKVYMPENIQDIAVGNYTVLFKVKSIHGISDVDLHTTVNITGTVNIKSGIKLIVVESKGNYVEVRSE